jgi:ATP-dependent DNA helicase RecG
MSTLAPARAPGIAVPKPPCAFATGEEQDRERLRAAPLRTRPRPSRLAAGIATLRGAGPRLAEAASELGVDSLGDLLWHVPHGYRDRTTLSEIAELRLGQEATVIGEVRTARLRPTRRRGLTIFEATVADDSGPTKAVWFNQPWLADQLEQGTRVLLHGKLDGAGFKVDAHEVVRSEPGNGRDSPTGLHTTGIVPVHSASARLRPQKIREWAWQARGLTADAIEPLPAALRKRLGLASACDALAAAHFPAMAEDAEVARARLAFEELFLHQAALATRRHEHDSGRRAPRLGAPGELTRAWIESLPFELTGDQRRATEEIDADLASDHPMQRLLMGEVGSGKAQPLDSLVLTPSGFKRMGSINVGDDVLNPTGEVTKVTGVFPQGERDVLSVLFSDGTRVKCDPEHLWPVRTSCARHRGDSPTIKTTSEIAADLRHPNGSAKWHLELPRAADLEGGGDRPLDPYLLGLLLGDGGFSVRNRIRFTSADTELIEAVRRALPPGCTLSRESHRPYDWKLVGERRAGNTEALAEARRGDTASMATAYASGASHQAIAERVGLRSGTTVRYHLLRAGIRSRPAYRPNPVVAAITRLGLMGKRAADKEVPEAYLVAPIHVRHALLQGLLDTDGTLDATTGSNVTFASASCRLAENVAWLVRSLGGRARCRERRVGGKNYWLTSVILPPEYRPFRLRRKAELLKPRTKYADPAKAIIGIERVGRQSVQCISVKHPNQLYVTDHFTTTHNTVVALYAMLRAVESGHQAALMAPTETLAEQHFQTLERLLAGAGLPSAALLTGSTPAARRREHLGHLETGQLELVVGTHALIEGDVAFARLALAVVDEQHRFGVRQRAALDAKGPGDAAPHTLHMTATPIPRTLSLTAYGDLDVTALHELPAGRRPVRTWVVGEEKRAGAYEFIRERLREGRQAFVVCPLVSESDRLQARAATKEGERLAKGEFRDFEVDVLHGQMKASDKQRAMGGFASGETQVLVATSVVEVGIDVPNASVMVIEEADRYGLSQLHQLRGRVGRGEHESHCILFADTEAEAATIRLEAISSERDGFKLAEVDLSLRGEGEILGTRQHGLPRFRVATLPEDSGTLLRARDEVLALLRRHGSLDAPELGPLMDAARLRFGDERAEPIAA